MNKENKVLDNLREKTFEQFDEEHVFEAHTIVGTTLDDSIGIMLSANVEADKMVLQIGEHSIPLSPKSLLFITKSVGLLAAVVASKGPNEFTELLDKETSVEAAGEMDAFISQEHEGDMIWIKAANTNSVTQGLLPKRAIMTDGQKKRHSDVLDRLLDESVGTIKEEEELLEEEEEEEFELGEEEIGLDEEEDYDYEEKEEYEDPETEEEETEEQDEGFVERMKAMENTLTGAFEIKEEEEPSFERIAEIKEKHGELAAREYVESLTQEQKEELVRLRLEAKAAAEAKAKAKAQEENSTEEDSPNEEQV